MSFSKPQERYASFGIVASLPSEIIDSFWEIIDHYLLGVFDLQSPLQFRLLKNQKQDVTIEYRSHQTPTWIQFDLTYGFNPSYPREIHVVYQDRAQVLVLPEEWQT